jgi:hypothetical protein
LSLSLTGPSVGGRGSKLSARLRGLLEAQRAFLEDCLELGDLASASRLLGVSVEAAERLAARLRRAELERGARTVACTKEARRALDEALEAVGAYARTSMARHSIKLTLPSLDLKLIEERRRLVEEARGLMRAGLSGEASELLKRAEPSPPRLPKLSVALALTSRALVEEASARYGGLVDVELIDSAERARAVVEGHDVTLTMGELPVKEPGIVPIGGLEDQEVVPHVIVELYASWLPTLTSSLRLAEAGFIKPAVDLEEARRLVEELNSLAQEAPARRAPLEDALDWVEDQLAQLKAPPPLRLADALAEEALRRFKLSSREAEALRRSLSSLQLPLPRLELAELRAEARRRWAEGFFNRLRGAARLLLQRRGLLKSLVRAVVDLDRALAAAEFMEGFGASWAEVTKRLGLAFVEARNLTLALEEKRGGPKVQPVSYSVGETSTIKLLGATPQRVVLLTGANSGGKTTLLRTMAQVHLMTLAGLPVLARRAEVPLAALYLIRRRTARRLGSLEYAIRRLRLIFTRPGAKLVLIDEFEALTEPGAMGRMMAALLNSMPRRALTVFVTHLAREIMPSLKVPFRVDGVEAKGVDERGELIVDRQPIFNHLGSSTPELVVERLRSLTSNRRLRRLYDDMLAALKAGAPS